MTLKKSIVQGFVMGLKNIVADAFKYACCLYTRYPIVARALGLAECVARAKVSCIQACCGFKFFEG